MGPGSFLLLSSGPIRLDRSVLERYGSLCIAIYPMTLAETSKLGSLRDWRWMSWRRRVELPERLASPSPHQTVGIMKISPHSVGGAVMLMGKCVCIEQSTD